VEPLSEVASFKRWLLIVSGVELIGACARLLMRCIFYGLGWGLRLSLVGGEIMAAWRMWRP
jgi:hypothetical protein